MSVFLSYNHVDRDIARGLGAHLTLAGADVWFDQWEIRAGDSIPGKLNEGLTAFDTLLLLWSAHASRSQWVRKELEAAIQRGVEDASIRVIPVRLDQTNLPPLLRPVKRLDYPNLHDIQAVVREVMGFATERDRIRAIQSVIESAQINVDFYHGYGPIAGCPQCGAGLEAIECWNQIGRKRGDQYAGACCRQCGWNDGGEVY